MTRLRGKKKVKDSGDEGSGSGSESEGSDGDGEEGDGLEAFEGSREECKLVLVVRTDLGMGKGTRAHAHLGTIYLSIHLFSSPFPSLSFPL